MISKEVAYDLLKAVHREDFKTGKACAMLEGIGNGLERIAALRILLLGAQTAAMSLKSKMLQTYTISGEELGGTYSRTNSSR